MERAAKRARRHSAEDAHHDTAADEWTARDSSSSAVPTASSSRPRRGTVTQLPATAVIQRSSPEETRQSIHLTVKSSPGKLRQATSGPATKAGVSRQNIVSGKRASRNSRAVREVDSDDDDDDDDDEEENEEDDAEEVDAMDVDGDDDDDEDEDEEEDEDMDGEADEMESVEADADEEETVKPSTSAARAVVPAKQAIPVKPAKPSANVTKSLDKVEAKERVLEDDDDDDLSDPDSSSVEDEDEEEEEADDDVDAEGEEDDEVAAANDDGDLNSDDDLSRGQTPDLTKMTKRQRALVEEGSDGGLMALSNEAQKKKHLTAEEHAMRRAEMARRRKNLSEKRNEEEKLDTINRLLKKQPPKRGRRAANDGVEGAQEEEPEEARASPLFVRYIQNMSGTQLGVPDEWLQSPVAGPLAHKPAASLHRPWSGKMVEEIG